MYTHLKWAIPVGIFFCAVCMYVVYTRCTPPPDTKKKHSPPPSPVHSGEDEPLLGSRIRVYTDELPNSGSPSEEIPLQTVSSSDEEEIVETSDASASSEEELNNCGDNCGDNGGVEFLDDFSNDLGFGLGAV